MPAGPNQVMPSCQVLSSEELDELETVFLH